MQLNSENLVADFSPEELDNLAQLEKAELIELLVRERQGWRLLLEELEDQHLSEWDTLERDFRRVAEECFTGQKNWASTLKTLSDIFSRSGPQ